MNANKLPTGQARHAVPLPHFPDRLHAYIWRNWPLAPVERLAEVIGATPEEIIEIGRSMGLSDPPEIGEGQWRRSYVTILRRNWHLLPYEQLTELLGWTLEHMDYVLREGDGLFWWFGGQKPRVAPLQYSAPTEAAKSRAAQIASILRESFPEGVDKTEDGLFAFVSRLSTPVGSARIVRTDRRTNAVFSPRFCYSYFGPFRAPLSHPDDVYPEGYLARLAEMGVDGVWLHEPLYRLVPFPWDAAVSRGYEECVDNLRGLVSRAEPYGIAVYLYLNEPRPMPVSFFEKRPHLKGVTDMDVLRGQVATLCTSVEAVQDYLRDAVAFLCGAVPDLAGIFTITASESYTHCWSHYRGDQCPRCAARSPEEVIAEVNRRIAEGMSQSRSHCRLFVWDWGWRDEWVEGIIRRLPADASVISVSEWAMPIQRGGVAHTIGEYALSVIGPGPRAERHWRLARDRGLRTIAKIQAGTTWELGAVPYIPVVENVARHVAGLRDVVDGLMLSWTLGGYPSPNLEAIMEMGQLEEPSVDDALLAVATRRFGFSAAAAVVEAWKEFSAAFREYPFSVNVLYQSPVHLGPANLLWAEPTGYRGSVTMGFGYPFDDIESWCGVYPPSVVASQFDRLADGFEQALARLKSHAARDLSLPLREEIGVAEACAIHFRSVANQVRFVRLRDQLAEATVAGQAMPLLDALEDVLRNEIDLAVRLHAIQRRDSRIGFEAACQYFYVSVDLGEKVLNCRDLLSRWLPEQRKKWGFIS